MVAGAGTETGSSRNRIKKEAGMKRERIGLIDVDSHNYPNLPLMKISAWHKQRGDLVEWYEPLLHGFPQKPLDRVYMSKVFSFSHDYEYYINAEKIIRGGSGYCIETVNGKETYHPERDSQLPQEIEHIYPDYSIYPELTKETTYGFMSRGCPRGCSFCHVEAKEGKKSHKVAGLSEFWRGQKNIVLLDPNPIACPEWRDILQQLIDSDSWVDFTQGVDIRLMTEEKALMIKSIKTKNIHFAWDRYEDKDSIIPKLRMFKEVTGYDFRKLTVYVLCNFDTTIGQDLERIYTLRDLGYNPFVMLYNKEDIPKNHKLKQLQRWVNNRIVFNSCKRFEDFDCRK